MRVEFKWHFSIRFIKTVDPIGPEQPTTIVGYHDRLMNLDAEIERLTAEGMIQTEIAKRVGINQGGVSRRLRALKEKAVN